MMKEKAYLIVLFIFLFINTMILSGCNQVGITSNRDKNSIGLSEEPDADISEDTSGYTRKDYNKNFNIDTNIISKKANSVNTTEDNIEDTDLNNRNNLDANDLEDVNPINKNYLDAPKELNIEVNYLDGFDININHTSSDNTFTLQLGRCGINNLFNIKSINYTPLTATGKQYILKSATDWIGPYIVEGLNGLPKLVPEFTGGWHSREKGSEEISTAYCSEFILYIDNKEVMNSIVYNELSPNISDNPTSYICNIVSLETTNYVNGYNTDYPILKEKITYTIIGRKVNVKVEGEALSDIVISKYYGLQSQNLLWEGNIKYVYSDGTNDLFPVLSKSQSKNKNNCKLSKVILSSQDQKLHLIMGLNTKSGLGKLTYLGDDLPICFTESYGKTYFNLINGLNLNLKKHEQYSWEGYYQFLDE